MGELSFHVSLEKLFVAGRRKLDSIIRMPPRWHVISTQPQCDQNGVRGSKDGLYVDAYNMVKREEVILLLDLAALERIKQTRLHRIYQGKRVPLMGISISISERQLLVL